MASTLIVTDIQGVNTFVANTVTGVNVVANTATANTLGANVATANSITVGNVVANTTALTVGVVQANTTALRVGSNVIMSAAEYFVGNSTVNAVLSATSLTVGGVVHNTSVLAVGANVIANTTALLVGNSTVYATVNTTGFSVAGIPVPAATGDWTDLASAATTNLGATANYLINITGTTGITSFGTASAGIIKRVKFAGALIITYNATSVILPGAANITTVAGDTATLVSHGSGNWRMIEFQRNGTGAIASLLAGTSAGNLVQLDGSSQLPAVSGALLTGIPMMLELLSTVTISGSTSSIELLTSTAFSDNRPILITFRGLKPAGNDSAAFYFRRASDSTYPAVNWTNAGVTGVQYAAAIDAASASLATHATPIGTSGRGLSGWVIASDFSSSKPIFIGKGYMENNVGAFKPLVWYGMYTSADISVNGIKFAFSSSNITAGEMSFYKIKGA